ncbi:MAG TPA: glycoside hydrolase family 88 protein, partial [Sunxiuqinia sp.]|nr:glycoside hydrolase family 88 protein [Sunxiuqinia sp.]
GYDGLLKNLIIKDYNGNLNLARICKSAGLGGDYSQKVRDGSFNYYAFIEPIVPNDGKGTGPFLMAATEIEMAEANK